MSHLLAKSQTLVPDCMYFLHPTFNYYPEALFVKTILGI
jgi:hypothetical protein